MLFNSHIFIFTFLPLCLAGWYVLNHLKLYRIATIFMIGMSLWFYGYMQPRYLILIAASTVINFLCSLGIDRLPSFKKPIFIAGLIANIGILGYFKYYDFFVENINLIFGASFELKHILLPLAISFFTLGQIAYIADRYSGRVEHVGFIDYSAFVTFFPKLLSGPIASYEEFEPLISDHGKRKLDPENLRAGAARFVIGLIKKILIADLFAHPANYGFANISGLDTLSAWVVAISYTLEIYFDFSGYSDMAIGIAQLFNLELPENFDSPYKALDVRDFWKRWHITLTRFLTGYIYIPLGGNRKGTARKYLNILIVFFISGFWHGAGWTFIIWGLMHGIAQIWAQRKSFRIKHRFPAWLCTFLFVSVAWVAFRSSSFSDMCGIYKAMFLPKYNGFLMDIGSTLTNVSAVKIVFEHLLPLSYRAVYWIYVGIILIGFVISGIMIHGRNSAEIVASQKEKGFSMPFTLILGVLFAICLISMTGVSTFLYFNF